ncbi:tRNA preQ1(34) S-adenosylmethionine ribosyltransferase-isomerase QueA [Ammoniphilus oxalaticus]|uniref:S-adenosylmethionine:tRNA ribosyltransferase-isomerase n=1 Tax=Ammoniphilus oxalaticus TaxID=66863 RepID=A0A419SIS9_9BACL|nr:tRNA preQ1(34) S-adenosylmethionine ribosyltransferase-isomerase QueA [Ammoniphilus oxalaticus]RKD23921.1 tRNA preQ1(34) S-adenosylmethionine ribosyltransferase-isomerase QueA [Ammoniphilus oxalaticus]
MDVTLFDFDLPEKLIAQTPLQERTASRLLAVDKQTGKIEHRKFTDLLGYLQAGDLLVLNDTRVLPARLFGVKQDTGAKVELLLLKQLADDRWETLARPGKKIKQGATLSFGDGKLTGVCEGYTSAGGRVVRFEYEGIFNEILDELGQMPLPPYIKEQLNDAERYQTVFAKHPGSAAAPTAGLHFSEAYLQQIRRKGIQIAYITLHVGLGTFRPVQVDEITEHKMHAEYYSISEENAALINRAKSEGKRVIAIGTTATRALETVASSHDGTIVEGDGWTDIFIYPGYSFSIVDGMITNFHLPKSTLVMLVSAFAGRELILRAYHEAIQNEYRFFSFGDAMFIV